MIALGIDVEGRGISMYLASGRGQLKTMRFVKHFYLTWKEGVLQSPARYSGSLMEEKASSRP